MKTPFRTPFRIALPSLLLVVLALPAEAVQTTTAPALDITERFSCQTVPTLEEGRYRVRLADLPTACRNERGVELRLRFANHHGSTLAIDTTSSTAPAEVAVYDDCTPDEATDLLKSAVAREEHPAAVHLQAETPCVGLATVLSANRRDEGIDLVFKLASGNGITGQVRTADTNAPLPTVSLNIFRYDGTIVDGVGTDQDGRYTVGGLEDGVYFLQAFGAGEYLGQLYGGMLCPAAPGQPCDHPLTGTPIVVTGDTLAEAVDFALPRGGRIRGRIQTPGAPGSFPAGPLLLVAESGLPVGSTANTDGRNYTMIGVIPGTYYVGATGRDLERRLYPDVLCGLRCPLEEAQPVTVGLGEEVTGIDLTLGPEVNIAGQVVDAASGEPLGGIDVRISDATARQIFVSTFTNGQFLFDGSPGTYYLTGSARNYNEQPLLPSYYHQIYLGLDCPNPNFLPDCDPLQGTPIALSSGQTLEDLVFPLDRYPILSGRITDAATGQTLVSMVEVFNQAGDSIEGFPQDDGYIAYPAFPGPYYVVANPPGYIPRLFGGGTCFRSAPALCNLAGVQPLHLERNESHHALDIALHRGGAIAGRVTLARARGPLEATVVALTPAGEILQTAFAAAANGVYTLEGLPPGEYLVGVPGNRDHLPLLFGAGRCPGDSLASCNLAAATRVRVLDGQTTRGINLVLLQGAQLSGRLQDKVTGELFFGDDKARITLWNEAGEAVKVTNGINIAGLDNIPPGRYFVTLEDVAGYADSLYRGLPCPGGPGIGCNPTRGTLLVLRPHENHIVRFPLEPQESLSGWVVDAATYVPIHNVRLDVWRIEDGQGRLLLPTSNGLVSSNTGGFTARVEPGTYILSTNLRDSNRPDRDSITDQVYPGIDCPLGPARSGLCGDPAEVGMPIQVVTGSTTPRLIFALEGVEPAVCHPSSTTLCLLDGRFQVAVRWSADDVQVSRTARAQPLTDDAGYFWFFDEDNVEVVVKMVEACGAPFDRYWVFAAGLTNVGVEVTVTDLWTGQTAVYHNPLGQAFLPSQDTDAFATCPIPNPDRVTRDLQVRLDRLAARNERHAPSPPLPASEPLPLGTGCTSTDTRLCLNQGRFAVEMFWGDGSGAVHPAAAVPLTADTGYFWFFDEQNIEAVVKVLDACVDPFDRYWVFAAGLTNVEVLTRVTDTATGEVREYRNRQGTAFQPLQDTEGFQTCP